MCIRDSCKSNGVKQIVTAATSAVREAPNGQDFIRRVFDETGIQIEMISGSEEARLIYLGVLSGMAFEDQSFVIIDIGTNSTHLLVAEINIELKSFSIKFTDKSTTRLGERDEEGNLTEESIQRALVTLKRFKEYCTSNGVKQIVTAATSAVLSLIHI